VRLRRFDIAAVRAISWDVDGTLYSTRKVALRLGFAILPACLRGTAQESWAALAEMRRFRARMELLRSTDRSLAIDDASIERRIQFERRWLCPAIAATGARSGAADAVRCFATRFETQVALSDFECGHKLASLGLAAAFRATYAGERLGHLKPSPQLFLRVLRDLELPPQALLHIGDRADTDGAGAEAAGCNVLLLGRDFRTFTQLRAMLAAGARPDTTPPTHS
jgi:putative hydrolase of the HAD superfamily